MWANYDKCPLTHRKERPLNELSSGVRFSFQIAVVDAQNSPEVRVLLRGMLRYVIFLEGFFFFCRFIELPDAKPVP